MPRGTGKLQLLARELRADDRSLRRAVEIGAVHCRRPSPRRLVLDEREEAYLHDHWGLLSALRGALRTEPNVRTAVLFGSVARGTEHGGSDLDLLVELEKDSTRDLALLEERLGERLDSEVQAVRLSDALAKPPFLWTILQEGRPLVDRDGTWAKIRRRAGAIKHEAKELRAQASKEAHRALTAIGSSD